MKAGENPFRYERTTRLPYRPPGGCWPTLLARLEAMRHWGAVVGPHGSGKSRAMEKLEEDLHAAGHRVVKRQIGLEPVPPWEEWSRGLPARGEKTIVLVDGADLLDWRSWSRLKSLGRTWGGLVVTSHRRRLLPVWLRLCPTPADLEAILGDLLKAPPDEAMRRAAGEIFRTERGNLHQVWRRLYDLCFQKGFEGSACLKTF